MHDVIVLSDLHIGKGRSPRTRRFHGLETFFFDEDLRRFLQWCCGDAKARGTSVRVVFNGDTFDLLRMDDTAGAEASRRERRFGADLTPAVAAQLVAQILEGHPIFVEAVADVVAEGSQVVFLPGNHDLEVQWSPVHDEMRRAVRAALERRSVPVDEALGRLSFAPWFVYEPGRIWIEHGCQYDPENAYRYPLRGALEADALDPNLLELDMPLGNFFQKYLYNGFGPLTFIVPSTRANARYSRWLLLHQPKLLLRVVWSHAPFALQAIRRLTAKKAEGRQSLEEAHARELARLAMESGLGAKLAAIDAQKTVRGDLMQATREYGLQGLRALMLATGFALAGTGLWASGFFAINELSSGFGLKALLFLVLNFVMMAAVGGATAYLIVREGPPPSPWPQRRAARRIARLLGVPFVTFGHTHEEAVWPIRRRDGSTGWYYNTGTWISVFTHDVLLPRDRVQFTFLRVKGMEAELLHWSPGRGEPLPVILLDEPDGIAAAPTAAPVAEVS